MTSKKLFPLGPQLEAGDSGVEVIASRVTYKRFLTTEHYTLRSRRFDGQMTEAYERDIGSTGSTGLVAAVLPYDPVRDVVVLIEQFRLPAYISKRTNGWTLEPVAGVIEAGGTPEDTARREALEEAGREIKRMVKVGHYLPSPGISTEIINLFIGEVEAGTGGEIGGLAEEHEDIRSHVLSFDDVLKLADEDLIDNANCLLAINWLARNREKLRAEWLKD